MSEPKPYPERNRKQPYLYWYTERVAWLRGDNPERGRGLRRVATLWHCLMAMGTVSAIGLMAGLPSEGLNGFEFCLLILAVPWLLIHLAVLVITIMDLADS